MNVVTNVEILSGIRIGNQNSSSNTQAWLLLRLCATSAGGTVSLGCTFSFDNESRPDFSPLQSLFVVADTAGSTHPAKRRGSTDLSVARGRFEIGSARECRTGRVTKNPPCFCRCSRKRRWAQIQLMLLVHRRIRSMHPKPSSAKDPHGSPGLAFVMYLDQEPALWDGQHQSHTQVEQGKSGKEACTRRAEPDSLPPLNKDSPDSS